MDWYEITERQHARTIERQCELSALAEEWERELGALWRLEADVNNGAYLQFISNWGRETCLYASQALLKIGALQMAKIIDRCQALLDEHITWDDPPDDLSESVPKPVLKSIDELSYEFMDYPDNIPELGLTYYRPHLKQGGE